MPTKHRKLLPASVASAACVVSLALTAAAPAIPFSIQATKTASPGSNPAGQDVDADNRLRAYASAGDTIDGWMSFDLSAISSLGSPVVVTSAELTLYAEGDDADSLFESVEGTPVLIVSFSGYDGWTRGGSGFPDTGTAISDPTSGPFPGTTRTPFTIDLLTSTEVNWTNFLADSELSLFISLTNDPAGDNWAYWYGSGERPGDNTIGGHAGEDPAAPGVSGAFAPRLTLEYVLVPEPTSAVLIAVAALTTRFGLGRRRPTTSEKAVV